MTIFGDLIEETRDHLLTGGTDRLNQLSAPVGANATSLPLSFPGRGISEGSILNVDLEDYYVISSSGTTATVIPGYNGSTSTTHDSGAIVRVNSKFSGWRISKRVNQAIENLSADGLFRVKFVEFVYSPSVTTYDLDADDLIDILQVKYDIPGPSQEWPAIPKGAWFLDQDPNSTDFAGGKSLQLSAGGFPGHKIRVSYKASFAPLAAIGDDVLAVSGIHNEAHKLVPIGAALILLGGREVKRSFTERQPEPRRQEEVPVGAATQSITPLLAEYRRDLRRERRRLRRRFPDAL